MINTSADYKEAIRARRLHSAVGGYLTLSNGTRINITERMIIKDSLSFTNRCTDVGEFNIGSVYVGELTVELLTDIQRYRLKDARITLFQKVELLTGIYEDIPLGTYQVSEVTRTSRTVYLRCYDDMLKFDALVDYAGNGTAYDLYAYICKKCGVTLGNTQSEIEALPNSEKLLYLSSERVKTYREALSYIARLNVAFCTIGRDGKLYVKSLADVPAVDTIEADRRISSTIYDYETYFIGVKARFIAEQNFYPYEEGEGYEGITIDLGDIPILYGLDDLKHEAMSQIWNVVKRIRYNPCVISMVGDASLEIGDYVIIENANGSNDDIKALVTSISWTHHGQMEVSSDGKDAKLENIQTQTQRDISNIQTSMSGDMFSLLAFTNINAITSRQAYQLLGNITFASRAGGMVVFSGVIKLRAEEVCKVSIKYDLNSNELDFVHVCQVPRGEHTITLFVPVPTVEGQSNIFHVYISSTENAIIEEADFRGSIYGVGLVADKWTGLLEVNEKWTFNRRGKLRFALVDGDISSTFIAPNISTAEDEYSLSRRGKLRIAYNETIRPIVTEPQYNIITEDGDVLVTTEGDFIVT